MRGRLCRAAGGRLRWSWDLLRGLLRLGLWSLTWLREPDCYGGDSAGYGRRRPDPRPAHDGRRALSDDAGSGLVGRGRAAAARGEWQDAFDLLMEADAVGVLSAADLAALGEVSYAAGHLDVSIESWERAHAASLKGGDQVAAAGAAVRVAMHLLFDTALMAPVRGWLTRAEGLLEGREEAPAHAWFAVVRSYERMLIGDLAGAHRWALRAIEVGAARAPAAAAIGGVAEARLLIFDGDVQRGLALLGEAGAAALSGGACIPPRPGWSTAAGVRPAGPGPVRPCRAMDRGDGAVVPGQCHRQPSRALPRAPGGDPPAARCRH